MGITFEQSKDQVAGLVKRFGTNRDIYRGPAYKEAHARQEFIDPFFLLGGLIRADHLDGAIAGNDQPRETQAAPDPRRTGRVEAADKVA